MSLAKAIAIRDELASEFAQRLPSITQTLSFSTTDGAPLLALGSGTAGTDSVFIKVGTVAGPGFKNVVGLAQEIFTPHVISIVIEANPTAGSGADIGTWGTRFPVIAAAVVRGTRVDLYQTATATGPSESGIASANLKSSFEICAQYPLMASN